LDKAEGIHQQHALPALSPAKWPGFVLGHPFSWRIVILKPPVSSNLPMRKPRRLGRGGAAVSLLFLVFSERLWYNFPVNTTITAKLKLHTTKERYAALLRTSLAYRDALNYTSRVAFENGKMSNQVRLHQRVYREIRSRFSLPAQMACSVSRQVGATYKALWTRAKQNAAHKKAGYTKKRYKGLDKAPVFSAGTTTFVFKRDYRWKSGQQVSITTVDGPILFRYEGYQKHLAMIQAGSQNGISFGEAKPGVIPEPRCSTYWSAWRWKRQIRIQRPSGV